MLAGTGKISNRKPKTDGKAYDQFTMSIPKVIYSDSQFPFKAGQHVLIEIVKDDKTRKMKLVVSELPQEAASYVR
jgi:hypothetical protein